MKRPTMLLTTLLAELGVQCCLPTERDVDYCLRRIKYEGLSFLTIILPTFDDLLLEGLENGRFPLDKCLSFGHTRRGGLPKFLSGFLKRIFDKGGFLLPSPDPDCIYAVRQVCRIYKKILLECKDDRLSAAIDAYKQVERDLQHVEEKCRNIDVTLERVSNILWSSVFGDVCPTLFRPRHGPGATAERFSPNKRNRLQYWYSRFEGSFPVEDYAIPNWGWYDHLSEIDFLDLRDEKPVRVVFVPKTQKSPRVIAIEPSTVQFVQQSVLSYMVPRLEEHQFTRESVHFTNQGINQALACSASKSKWLATIDLSEASDRVSLELVRSIFRKSPILQYLEDSRSLHADLPNGENLILRKFASMGSALCFPVEACVFYTLIQSALHIYFGRTPSSRSIITFSKMIDVYGDDIIIPSALVGIVSDYLELHGLKVNRGKSFSKGNFRESCGGDFYNGVDVKPVYVRYLPPPQSETLTPNQLESLVSTSNQFYLKGLWKTSQLMRDWIEAQLGPVPRNTEDYGGLVFRSFGFKTRCHYDGLLHRYVQRCVVFKPRKRLDDISGDDLASFNKLLPIIGVPDKAVSLSESVKRGDFKQIRRWVTAQ